MSSSVTARRLFAVRGNSGVFFDVTLAVALFVGSLALLVHGSNASSRYGSAALNLICVVLAACSTIPLIAWRRSPFGVFSVTAAASVLLAAVGHLMELPLGLTVALYLVATSREADIAWTRRTTATAVGLLVTYLGAVAASQMTFPAIVELHTGLVWAVAWLAGERTRLRNEQITELREHALGAEREAEAERLLAVAEERARIARDLHDSAGHAISVIAVRAGAARLRHRQDPDRSLSALEAIEELARHTVEEIDQIVGILREDNAAKQIVENPPGLASLETLIAQRAAAGLEVTFNVSGTLRQVGAAADQAAYRILQEALTNAARHGAGRATIELAFGDEAVDLTVINPVPVDKTPRLRGHGLVGIRERAILLGGKLHAEHTNGTFRVCARIPYGGDRA